MLRVEHLCVKYSGITVVRDVSFSIAPGEIVAYLGTNGAGKTTTVKALTGLLAPSCGRVLLEGHDTSEDPIAFRRRLGYLPETADIYPFLSGREYLILVGRLRSLSEEVIKDRVDGLLDLLELSEHRHQALGSFSKGMTQKVLLAAALLHDPDILILDEPLSGLDVAAVLMTKALLRSLARRGRIILYSTHMLEVAERLCDRALILYGGRIVADDTVANLRKLRRQPSLEQVFANWVLDTNPDTVAERLVALVSGDTEIQRGN